MLDRIKVYCGTWGKYASGSLFGEWIRLEEFSNAEEFFEYCRSLHKDENDPKFMFQNIETDDLTIPQNWLNESCVAGELWEVEEEICGEHEAAFLAFVDDQGIYDDVWSMYHSFKDIYVGSYDSFSKFVEYHFWETEGCRIPEDLHYAIDMDVIERNYSQSFRVLEDGEETHVFYQ